MLSLLLLPVFSRMLKAHTAGKLVTNGAAGEGKASVVFIQGMGMFPQLQNSGMCQGELCLCVSCCDTTAIIQNSGVLGTWRDGGMFQ